MALRNFWLDASVDGRKTDLRGGPRNKTGGINLVIYQRDDGEKAEAVRIYCTERDGKLQTEVWMNNSFCGRFETRR